jgi:hypothetical protein
MEIMIAKIPNAKWVSKKEFEAILEARCQRVLGISLAKFRKQLARGKYRKHHDGVIVELMILVND